MQQKIPTSYFVSEHVYRIQERTINTIRFTFERTSAKWYLQNAIILGEVLILATVLWFVLQGLRQNLLFSIERHAPASPNCIQS